MFTEKYSKSYRREIARKSAREWLPKNDFNVHTRGPFIDPWRQELRLESSIW